MPSPEELFARFRQHGDAEALAAVFDALAPRLVLVAAHVARAGTEAEDLVQATFVDAMQKAARWDATRPLLPWLIGILANHARIDHRAAARRIDASRLPAAVEPSPLDALAAGEVAEQVAQALERLPRQLRQALTLRLVHGLSAAEIARAVGCPVATAKTRLQRGMEWLRRVLPASIAVSVAGLVTAGRGLAAVRAAVVEQAKVLTAGAAAVSAGAAAGLIAGGLVMKKVAVVLLAVLCVAAFWIAVPRAEQPPGSTPSQPGMPAAARAEAAPAPVAPVSTAEGPQRVAMAAGDAATTGAAELEFVWKGEGTPAAGLVVSLQLDQGQTPKRRADANGKLHFTDLPAGRHFLSGRKLWHPIVIVAGEELRERVEVEPSLLVDGVVVDKGGRGIAGAEVLVQYFPNSEDLVARRLAVSDEAGRFHAATDWGGYVWARKPGFAPSLPQAEERDGRLQLRLVLDTPGTTLRGTVLAANGAPAEAQLTIVRTIPRDRCGAPLRVRSNAGGRFATDELGPGEHLLVAQAAGHAATPVAFTVVAGSAQDLQVRLAPGATICGQVLAGGKPVQGGLEARPGWAGSSQAWVEALRPIHHLFVLRTTPDAAGDYRLEHVPAGEIDLQFSPQGAAVGDRRQLSLQDGEVQRCDFLLATGGEIHGHIVNANGQQLQNWDVSAAAGNRGIAGGLDADGRFVFQGLDAAEYTITARPIGATFDWVKVEHVRPGPGELVLRPRHTPEDAASLVGMLFDDEGRPAAAAKLIVTRVGEMSGHYGELRLRDDGAFEAGPLLPGRYHLGIWIQDGGRIRVGERDLQPRARVDLGTLRLPATGTIQLRIATRDGRGVEPVDLWAWDPAGNGGRDLFERTADGCYQSRRLPAGIYRVHAWGTDFAACEQQIEVIGERDTPVPLTVEAAVPVHFEVPRPVGADGERWSANVTLSLRDDAGKPPRGGNLQALDQTGTFTWTRGLLPGRYTFEAKVHEGEPVCGEFVVAAGAAEQRVEIRLPAR